MARMVVIYRTPADPAAFNEHYFGTHVPLAKQLPGLRAYELSKGPIVGLAAAIDPYLVATLRFDSLGAIQDAFATELGRACAADRHALAPDERDVQILLFEDQPA